MWLAPFFTDVSDLCFLSWPSPATVAHSRKLLLYAIFPFRRANTEGDGWFCVDNPKAIMWEGKGMVAEARSVGTLDFGIPQMTPGCTSWHAALSYAILLPSFPCCYCDKDPEQKQPQRGRATVIIIWLTSPVFIPSFGRSQGKNSHN